MSTIYTLEQLLDLSRSELCKNEKFQAGALKFSEEYDPSSFPLFFYWCYLLSLQFPPCTHIMNWL